jgi:hypothetical protein
MAPILPHSRSRIERGRELLGNGATDRLAAGTALGRVHECAVRSLADDSGAASSLRPGCSLREPDREARLEALMSNRKLEVVQATPDRIGALAPVFGRAFVDEPMTQWSVGDRGDVADRLTRCFACFLEQVLGLGLVWEVDAGNGAAVWVSPNRFADWDVHPWSPSEDHCLDRRWRPPVYPVLGLGGFPPPGRAALATGLDRRGTHRSRSEPRSSAHCPRSGARSGGWGRRVSLDGHRTERHDLPTMWLSCRQRG